jgi:hemolysin activation/secretion protein
VVAGVPLSRPIIEAIVLKTGIISAALLTVAPAAYAQSTNAGAQLQQIPPTPQAPRAPLDLQVQPVPVQPDAGPPGATVRIDALTVTGATVFDAAALRNAAGFAPGQERSLSDLRAMAARISAFYHQRGYFLAQAYLPAQEISGGSVTIAVIEGRYGKVGLDAGRSSGVAQGILKGLDSGDIVTAAPLERRLLLLSDLPGSTVRSTLAPGSVVGTSDLAVELTPGRLISGSVEADNAGNRYTGTYRGGGTVNINNPTGGGDLLSLRILASTGGLAYGRVAYQAPIANLTLGVAYSHIRYELGREFKGLDADGTADIASVYASYPLVRSRDVNLYALGSLEAKWFEDRIGLVSSRSNKKSRVATIGLSGDSHDDFGGGGWTNVSGGFSYGDFDIASPLERAVDALTARRDGGFGKVDFAAARLQTVSGPLSLYGSVRGQLAFDNLDTSEQMELGGAYGVRAYPEGESYGDQGYIATAEARLTLSRWVDSFPGQLQAIAFVDVGEVQYAHDAWFTGSNHAHRSGVGGGLSWAAPEGFLLKASYAHRLGDQRVTSGPDHKGRFWFQIVKLF